MENCLANQLSCPAALTAHCQLIARQTNSISHEMTRTRTPVKKKVIYHAQRVPSEFGLRHLPEWIRLWRYRWGIETGIDELEPRERIASCNSQPTIVFFTCHYLVDLIISLILFLVVYKAASWTGLVE